MTQKLNYYENLIHSSKDPRTSTRGSAADLKVSLSLPEENQTDLPRRAAKTSTQHPQPILKNSSYGHRSPPPSRPEPALHEPRDQSPKSQTETRAQPVPGTVQQIYPYSQKSTQPQARVIYESPPAIGVGSNPRRDFPQASHSLNDPSLRYSLASQSAERASLSSTGANNRIIEHRPIDPWQQPSMPAGQVRSNVLHEPQMINFSRPAIQGPQNRVVQQSSLLQQLKPKPPPQFLQPQTPNPAPVITAKPVSSQIHSAQALSQLSPQVHIQPLTHEAISTISAPIVIRSDRSQSPASQAVVAQVPLSHVQSSIAAYHANLATQSRPNQVYHEIAQHQTPARPMSLDMDDGARQAPGEGAKMSLEYSKDGSSSFKYSLSNNRDPSL